MFKILSKYYTLSKIDLDKLNDNITIEKNVKIISDSYNDLLLATGFYEEKKSKFYSYIFNVSSQNKAINIVKDLKNIYHDSRHVVYLYSLNINDVKTIKFSDDGEPQGTGTKAIYETLEKENITNILVVIARYFGGTLLRRRTLVTCISKKF